MSQYTRGGEYPAGEHGQQVYPLAFHMQPAAAMRTSPPPLAPYAQGGEGSRAPRPDEARVSHIRHGRNSSSPARAGDMIAEAGAWTTPSPGGAWTAPSVASPRRRSHVFQPRSTPRMTDNARVPSPPMQPVYPLNISRPFSSSSVHSQGSASSNDHLATHPERVLIQATLDNEHFSVVNVSGLDTAPAIKACILRKLQIPTQDLQQWGLVRTEIGHTDLGSSLLIDDDTLLALCLQIGDDKGTVKFLVQRLGTSPDHRGLSPPFFDAQRLRGTSAPAPAQPRTYSQVRPAQKAASGSDVPRTMPWSGQTYATPTVHEAMVLGQWPAPQTPTTPRRSVAAPPIAPAPSLPSARNDPYVTSVFPASSNRQVSQFQMLAPHAAGTQLQPGMTVQTVLGVPSPGPMHAAQSAPPTAAPKERSYSGDAPASLQPSHPSLRHITSPPLVGADLYGLNSQLPSASSSSSQVSLPTRSPRQDNALELDTHPAPPIYEYTAPNPPPMRPEKPRALSQSSNDARPTKPRSGSSPSEARPHMLAMQRTASQSAVASDEHHSVYPLFKSDDRVDTPDARAADDRASVRPLPIIPSPVSASPSSSQTQDSGAPYLDRSEQRGSWGRELNSSVTAATSVSTPRSDTPSTEEEQRVASVQRLMNHMRMAEERKAESATFESFSDDTLGGTFAQSLDASTLRESDTIRADRSLSNSLEGSATPGTRPVLTLSISPTTRQAAQELPRASVERKGSFADRGQQWAFRPPAEQLYEQLDDLFPRHDLDRPLTDTASASPSSARSFAPALPKPSRGLARSQHHSIRIIAQNRKRFLENTKHVERRRAARDESLLDRRRSTKLWGGRMVEMKTNGPESVGLVPDAPTGPEVEPSSRPVFKWVKGDLIGKGTYGRVYLALNATTGEMIAVKQVELPRTDADRDSSRQRGVVAALKSEIETLKDLDHPNVVTCLGFEQTHDTLSIFLEYVPGGSIGSCLRKHGKFDEDTVSSFLNQTLQGLAYLHKQGILHRDLKADNLLVDFQGTCKISDFGTVRRSDNIYNNVENMSLQGSIFWMAPEVMSLSPKGYSAKVDIWSLGCVVLEMLAGRRPWSDEEAIHAMFKIGAERRAPPVPADCKPSKPAAHFLRNCFETNPDRRPTAARLLEHVFAWPSPEYCFENSALYKALHRQSVD